MNKIKKGNLNYDQSGRAYPNNPRLKENWDCIWKHGDKYYELVGDNEHKEWEEVNIYDRIIDEAYENYYENFYKLSDSKKWMKKNFFYDGSSNHHVYLKETFINKCKTNPEFSEKWGLKIEERELTYNEKVHEARRRFGFELEDGTRTFDINKTETIKFLQSTQRIISLTYNNETIEVYEQSR